MSKDNLSAAKMVFDTDYKNKEQTIALAVALGGDSIVIKHAHRPNYNIVRYARRDRWEIPGVTVVWWPDQFGPLPATFTEGVIIMSAIGNTLIPMVEHECTELIALLTKSDFDNAKVLAQSGKTLHAVLHLFATCGGVAEMRDFDAACRLLNISTTINPVPQPARKGTKPVKTTKTLNLPSRRAPAR